MTNDIFLCTLFGGICIGTAIAIVIRAGASTGGMDIPPLIINKYTRISVSVSLYVFDCIILALQAAFSAQYPYRTTKSKSIKSGTTLKITNGVSNGNAFPKSEPGISQRPSEKYQLLASRNDQLSGFNMISHIIVNVSEVKHWAENRLYRPAFDSMSENISSVCTLSGIGRKYCEPEWRVP